MILYFSLNKNVASLSQNKTILQQAQEPNMNRRKFLRAAGVCIALPYLESLAVPVSASTGPRNFVAIGTYLGWHQNAFYPKETGTAYTMPETLMPLAAFRDHFTIFSGLDHRAPNGHNNWANFLSGHTPKQYSVDQMIADEIGGKSRMPSIQLTAGAGEGAKAMSFTKQGIGLPLIQRPSVLYKRLFPSKSDRARTEYLLRSGRSALDEVTVDARQLQRSLPGSDADRLDQYFTSLRAVEKRMGQQLEIINEPIPRPDYQLPDYDPITPNLQMEAENIFYDLMALAIETESSRVLSMFLDGLGQVFSIDGRALGAGYHGLSHHGNDPGMIQDLIAIETAHVHCLAGFIKQLQEKRTANGKSLLNDTVVLVGTGMGDASRHSNRDLPTLVMGGGFNHQGHLAFDPKDASTPLLGDLYLTIMQKLGMEVDAFSNAHRNLNGKFS